MISPAAAAACMHPGKTPKYACIWAFCVYLCTICFMRFRKLLLLAIVGVVAASCSTENAYFEAQDDPMYVLKRVDDTSSDWPGRNQETSFIKNCVLADFDEFTKLFPRLHSSISRLDAGTNCSLAQFVAGGAVADFDGDGNLDIVETHPTLENATIWLGDGSGGFRKDARVAALGDTRDYGGVGVGDFDNDGHVDMVVSSVYGVSAKLLMNDGTGLFTDKAHERGIDMNDGNPHYGTGVTVFDYNEDGWLDVYIGEWRPLESASFSSDSHAKLFENQGYLGLPGHFKDVTQKAGLNMTQKDGAVMVFQASIIPNDANGSFDLLIVSDWGTSKFFKKTSRNTYEVAPRRGSVAQDNMAMGIAVGDLNGDGSQEVFTTAIGLGPACRCTNSTGCSAFESVVSDYNLAFTSGNRLFTLNGNVATDITDSAGVRNGGWGWGTIMVDVDNDGDLDILQTAGGEPRDIDNFTDIHGELEGQDPLTEQGKMGAAIRDCFDGINFRLWLNDGKGTMREVSELSNIVPRGAPRSLLAADFNNDGVDEIVVFRSKGDPYLYTNTQENIKPGLTVRFDNYNDSVGATVAIKKTENSTPMIRILGTQNSTYASYYGPYVIGLGNVTDTLYSVTVTFPGAAEPSIFSNVSSREFTVPCRSLVAGVCA